MTAVRALQHRHGGRLVPVTGIPLPFLSYGGSFMLSNFIVTGIILGVDFRRFVNR
jgi:rod shape determining protein RodA